MYTLNFPNGNVQTYPDYNSLMAAVNAFGGDAHLSKIYKIYAFAPKNIA